MSEMNTEERLVCALSHEEPDRVPLYDLVSNVAVIEHYAGQSLTLENAREVIPLALGRAIDHTRVWLPGPLGTRTDERGFTHERRDWFNEWQVGKPFHDIEGLAAFVKADIERLESWQAADPQAEQQQQMAWRERFAPTVIPACGAAEALTDAYILVGIDWFTWLDVEQPALVDRWINALHERMLRHLNSLIAPRSISPVAWAFADMALKGRLMFSPHYLRSRGVFRRIADICEVYHGYDLKVIFHSDGYLTPVVPDLIEAGVDAIAPVEVGAGMDLAQLKADFGSRVAFCGGLDVQGVLQAGTPEAVRWATLQALAAAGPGGGLILGSSSEELFDSLPLENVVTMFETTRECGRYPIGKFFPSGFKW